MYDFLMLKADKDNSQLAKYCMQNNKTVFDLIAKEMFKPSDYDTVRLSFNAYDRWLNEILEIRSNPIRNERRNIKEIIVNTIDLMELDLSVPGFIEKILNRTIRNRFIKSNVLSNEMNMQDKILIFDNDYGIRVMDENLDAINYEEIILSTRYSKELILNRLNVRMIEHLNVLDINSILIKTSQDNYKMPIAKNYEQELNRKLFKAKAEIVTMENWSSINKQIKSINTPGTFILTEEHLYWKIDNVKLEVPLSKRDLDVEWNDDYTIDLGNFIIKWKLGTNEFHFFNTNKRIGSGYQAPHVFSDGNPCFGTFDEIIAQCVELSDVEMLCHTLLRFLASANPKDAIGCNWVEWARMDGYEIDDEPENDEQECCNCGDFFDEEDMDCIDDDWYCQECKDDRFTQCNRCGNYEKKNSIYYVNDEEYCDHCYEEYCTTCDNCGDNILSDNSILLTYSNGSKTYVCDNCHKELQCQVCETHENLVEGDCICEECLEERNKEDEANNSNEDTDQKSISNDTIPAIPKFI